MRDEPCVKIPISELKWMIWVTGGVYVNLVDHTQASAEGWEGAAELSNALQDELEMAYLNEVLEARLREALTGDDTAPSLSLAGGVQNYLESMAARRNVLPPGGDRDALLATGR